MSGSSRRPARFLLAGAALLAVAACSRQELASAAKREPAPRILRVSQRNEPATLDPHLATIPDEFFVIRALHEGLVTPNPDGGAPLPGVAERWTTSADGLTWTFHLRANAKWSNGDPVVADDFVYSVRRVLSAALASPRAGLFQDLRNANRFLRGELSNFSEVGIRAADPRTLVLTLESPVPHLLAVLAAGPWVPVHPASVEKHGGIALRESAWTRPGNLVGNGPFVLREWRSDQHILLEPNPHYWQRARVKIDALRFQVYDNGDTEERAFRVGQVDVTMALPTSKLDAYNEPVRRRLSLHETRYLALNLTRHPLDLPGLRHALSNAIDRDALTTAVTKGGQRPARTFVPPGLGGYQSPVPLDAPVPAAARPDQDQSAPLEFSAWGVAPAVLEAIQQMWQQRLGVRADLVQREGKVHMAALLSGDFTIGFMPAIPDYDDPLAVLGDFVSGAAGNFPRWKNTEFDALVKEARRTPDAARRNALYRDAELILLRELPVIPLYFNTQNYLVSPRVRHWRQDALWNRYYLDVTLE